MIRFLPPLTVPDAVFDEALGIIDMKRGTKVGGARFYYLAGDGAWLQLGMLMHAAKKAREAGFKV